MLTLVDGLDLYWCVKALATAHNLVVHIIPTYHEGFDRSFRSVVVDIKLPVFEITNKLWPLIQAIGDRFTYG
jgi:hypothetical protein